MVYQGSHDDHSTSPAANASFGRPALHLLNLVGTTNGVVEGTTRRRLFERLIYSIASPFLAYKHLQERNGSVLNNLPALLLEACPDMEWSFEWRDTRFSESVALQQLIQATSSSTTSSSSGSKRRMAVVGDFPSRVTIPLSIVSSALDMVQISGSASSAQLDYTSPFFARTIPNDSGQAQAAIAYFQQSKVTHLVHIFVKDPYGIHMNVAVQNLCRQAGIRLRSIPYHDEHGDEDAVLNDLEQSGYRYVYATLFHEEDLMVAAWDRQLIGGDSGRVWFLSEKLWLTNPTYSLSASSKRNYKLARAIHGIGLVNLHFPSHERLDQALKDFANNTALQQEFLATINSHDDPELAEALVNYTFPPFHHHWNQYLYWDAVMALGIASCRSNTTTGAVLHQQLLDTQFMGASGPVSFDAFGNRRIDTVQYRIDNILLRHPLPDNSTTDAVYKFQSHLTNVVYGPTNISNITPFVFAAAVATDHNSSSSLLTTTMIPPLPLPPLDAEWNVLPAAAKGAGYGLGIVVLLMSLGFMGWTLTKRTIAVISLSQPIFLVQLCVGTTLMALAVFPMSLQSGLDGGPAQEKDYQQWLNAACMSTLWLLFLGFVIATSALMSKSWRLNRILNSGMAMRRIQVQAQDAIWPFCVFMTINVTLLLGMTVVSPLRFERVPIGSHKDAFDRHVESYGTCVAQDRSKLYGFLIPMLLVDLCGLIAATYQSFRARNLPTMYSESSYLAVSMISLVETLAIGGPILFALDGTNPTAFYVASTTVLCITCFTILLPVFLPKFWMRNMAAPRGMGASFVASSRRFSCPAINTHSKDSSCRLDDYELRPGMLAIVRRDNRTTMETSSMGFSKRSSRRFRPPPQPLGEVNELREFEA
ncbi:Gamma-aminobutyric acid (GABA) B receptor [Seminavis robusta]|uniref:Gamma-aminobutyric acid (GABA) B receptor n=1 Tax=Seminavis robusta TaxID=568900 RepID=A0A9N8DV12_9STRA|nr:Gamma-aminobutyric acid (GABA) B receptor [Seminavis robusta]|eukprot:Sro313_g114700.1 Gamma-aminobutyric acid (GABA) B receptor (873) ;mRNA; f:3007-5625